MGVVDKTLSHLDKELKICGHNLVLSGDDAPRVGGGGVIIPCLEQGMSVRYALKIARPSLFNNDVKASEEEFRKAEREYEIGLPLAHVNIAKTFGADRIEVELAKHTNLKLPATLVEWVEGAEPLDRYVVQKAKSGEELVALLSQVCHGLAHLHRSGRVHWDIKGDNVLVSNTGVVKLMDLGNARPIREQGDVYRIDETAESTDRNLPPDLQLRIRGNASADVLTLIDSPASPNRKPCRLLVGEPVWDRPWLDLYMLARETNRLLLFDDNVGQGDPPEIKLEHPAVLALRQRLFPDDDGHFAFAYLGEVIRRLLVGNTPTARPVYPDADSTALALDRYAPEYGEATDVIELISVPQRVVRIPPHQNVPWTPKIEAVMNSMPIARLKLHRQLATVVHVFPGAEHSRWEHALGAFNETLSYIRSLFADRSSVLFRLDAARLDIQALMLASLVHDVGHPAFGHQLEESPVVLRSHHHEQYATELLKRCSTWVPQGSEGQPRGPVEEDASALQTAIRDYWVDARTPFKELVHRTIEILSSVPGEPHRVGEESSDTVRRTHTEVLHSLLDGPLDADKADYLIRDAHHCGVEYSLGIDKGRLHQSLTGLRVERKGGLLVGMMGVTSKGVLPLESVLIARYQMFRAVYWQHTVRALTVMLAEALENYVVPARPSLALDEGRLSKLLYAFRSLPDASAIGWLAENLKHAPWCIDLCRALTGDRSQIYWELAGFHGKRSLGAGTEVAQITADDLYVGLQRRWTPPGLDPLTLVRQRRAFRQQLAAGISSRIRERTSGRSVEVDWRLVLVDVPASDRDAITDLHVARDIMGERSTLPLDSETPLAKSVADAFNESVRPARVFAHPSVGQVLLRDHQGRQHTELMRDIVTAAVTEQLDFKLD